MSFSSVSRDDSSAPRSSRHLEGDDDLTVSPENVHLVTNSLPGAQGYHNFADFDHFLTKIFIFLPKFLVKTNGAMM
jgi:hypothetical protein